MRTLTRHRRTSMFCCAWVAHLGCMVLCSSLRLGCSACFCFLSAAARLDTLVCFLCLHGLVGVSSPRFFCLCVAQLESNYCVSWRAISKFPSSFNVWTAQFENYSCVRQVAFRDDFGVQALMFDRCLIAFGCRRALTHRSGPHLASKAEKERKNNET